MKKELKNKIKDVVAILMLTVHSDLYEIVRKNPELEGYENKVYQMLIKNLARFYLRSAISKRSKKKMREIFLKRDDIRSIIVKYLLKGGKND